MSQFFIVLLLLSSCGNDDVAVTGVSLNRNTLTLGIGQTETLTATVVPSNAYNKNLEWSSDDENVVTVDASTGKVTGVSEGEVVITVTTRDGGYTDQCDVSVIFEVIRVTSVSLDKNSLTLEVGKYETLEVTVAPDNATDNSVMWSSSNANTASVNPSTGVITALAKGTAVITATTTDGSMNADCAVTVNDTVDPQAPTYNNVNGLVADCADPYILERNGTYYLYGTGGNDGIRVHTSTNLVNWSTSQGATNGYALHKNNVWGTSGFWAPEVYWIDGKYYMFYTANERLSMATASDPKGPFSTPTAEQQAFHPDKPEIDSHVFIDDDGKKYIYYVSWLGGRGNEISVAELGDDMKTMKESTIRGCIYASEPWERVQDQVAEGPFILKRGEYYYLTYSANHYQSKKYAVGYAYSKSPLGPWTKYSGNPILIGDDTNLVGTGHHSFFHSPSGALYIVYHAHNSPSRVQSRKTCIDRAIWDESTTPARLVIKGPTTTNQAVR